VKLREEDAKHAFYHDCPEADGAWAATRLRPDPLRPLLQRVSGAEDESLPRGYVACAHDRAITIGRQRAMVERSHFDRVVTMETGHSPFLSAPDELAGHLDAMSALGAS
jgi:hypothetical protein